MLSLYEALKASKTGISPDYWTMLAARKLCGGKYQPTKEDDYIYSGDTVLFYIGKKKRPEIPQTLGSTQVRVIECTAFTGQNITAVKIPEGTEVIE